MRMPTFSDILASHEGEVLAIDPRAMRRVIVAKNTGGARRVRVLGSRVSSYLGPPTRPQVGRQVAIVDVIGPLMQRGEEGWFGPIEGYDTASARIIEALEASDVGAVLVRVDSPGGLVAGAEEAIRQVVEVRERVGKPLAVFVDEQATSAAYWLASSIASAGVFSPVSGEVGSIGVYSTLVDERAKQEKEGVSVRLVREPAGKDALNPSDPILEVASARERQRVREVAQRFYAAVASARDLSVDAVRAMDAKVFGATEALSVGLIDGVCTLQQAIKALWGAKENHQMSRKTRAKRARRARLVWQARKRAQDEVPQDVLDVVEDPVEEPITDRATAAQVAAACAQCASACSDCAAACESGTADEAIASVSHMVAACEQAISIGNSFLGTEDLEEVEELGPELEDAGDTEETSARDGRRILRLLQSIKQDRDREREENRKKAELEERLRLIASRRMNERLRAWLEDPRTSMTEVRAACRCLPEAGETYFTADLTLTTAQHATHGLSASLIEKSRARRIDPEKVMKIRQAIQERSGGAQ